MMRYEFTKMQSLGNDFVVLDGVSRAVAITADSARRLADRHFGVGCDQVLLVERGDGDAAFAFRVFNHDGSEAEQCGNGMRCLAKFLRETGLSNDDIIRARVGGAVITLEWCADETVRVEMGVPEFAPAKIPFVADDDGAPCYPIDLGAPHGAVEIAALAIGNPHAVQRVADIAAAPVAAQGPLIEHHARFPARANASFMQVVVRDHIRLRVHERGVGETLGCGSGACAAVAAGIERGWLDARVRVSLPGGDAEVQWQGRGSSIFLRGPAHTVFCGAIDISNDAESA